MRWGGATQRAQIATVAKEPPIIDLTARDEGATAAPQSPAEGETSGGHNARVGSHGPEVGTTSATSNLGIFFAAPPTGRLSTALQFTDLSSNVPRLLPLSERWEAAVSDGPDSDAVQRGSRVLSEGEKNMAAAYKKWVMFDKQRYPRLKPMGFYSNQARAHLMAANFLPLRVPRYGAGFPPRLGRAWRLAASLVLAGILDL